MRKGTRSGLLQSLADAIDSSAYCGTYGDAVFTHPELTERLRDELGCAVANATTEMFTVAEDATDETATVEE